MLLFYWITGVLLGGIWLWQLCSVLYGIPKIVDITLPEWDATTATLPHLSVVVPARNEGDHIAACLTSLLSLDYPALEIIAVNDRSSDATGATMDEVAATPLAAGRLHIIHVTQLPEGWLGKTHAM